MGSQPRRALSAHSSVDAQDYCRQIEAHLCQKNDGHLIRVTGPAFEVVSGWLHDGIPFKVACEGIDRYVERYYRKGPRRRPVRVEFCDSDVRDVFEAWRRATGLVAAPAAATGADVSAAPVERRGPSLPEHLERVLLRLTNARATGRLGAEGDPVIDAVSSVLDEARRSPGGVRGERRQALLDVLTDLDARLMGVVAQQLDASATAALEREALEELDGFRSSMPPERFERSRRMAVDRLTRTRLGIPTLRFL